MISGTEVGMVISTDSYYKGAMNAAYFLHLRVRKVSICESPLYRLATAEKSQLATTENIHGGVEKAVGMHSTPLPLSSIKIHLVKGGPCRSIDIDR